VYPDVANLIAFTAMGMILPDWLMTMRLAVSSTRSMLETLPTSGGGLLVGDALAPAGLEAELVDAGAFAVAVLRDREDEVRTKFPKWDPSKINPEKVACFSSPNPDHQLTSFHQQSTTTSPRPTTRFHQNPHQKQGPTTPKKSLQSRRGFGSFGRMRRRLLRPGLRARGPTSPQSAQALRLRRMVHGRPKTAARKFSLEKYRFA
jgi:hypothetical protein